MTKRKRKLTVSDLQDHPSFLQWAEHATAGIEQSGIMLGLIGNGTKGARWEFAIQVGHCLLEGKPLILIAEEGTEIPEKLRLAATAIEFYRPDDLASMEHATKRGLEKAGLPVQH